MCVTPSTQIYPFLFHNFCLQALGVHIVAIGVGSDVDSRELAYIAEKNVILLTSFDEVLAKAHQTIEQLVRGTCGTGH